VPILTLPISVLRLRAADNYQGTASAAYHLMNTGLNRERYDTRLFQYCLMSNPFHLLFQPPGPQCQARMLARAASMVGNLN